MFAKPGIHGQGGLFAWSCLAFIILNVAYSCVNVPYNSLLPELSEDYDERSSITGVKSVYSIVGALLGAGAAMPVIAAAGGGATGFLAMGAWTLNTCGITVVTTTLVYYFKYVFGDARLITIASLVMLLAAMAFVPVVVRISKSLGKRTTYAACMSVVTNAMQSATALFVIYFLVGPATALLFVIALLLLALYPYDRKAYEDIRRRIERREAGAD